MATSRSRSTERPAAVDAGVELDLDDFPMSVSRDVASALVRLVTRAEAMGLIAPDAQIAGSRVEEALRALKEAGIGIAVVDQAKVDGDPRRAIDALNEALAQSPTPRPTARSLSVLLGVSELAPLVGSSEASVRRYASGSRTVPDDIAWRLHVLALVVADLAGSYNSFGIRRWFMRPRSQLDGRAPREVFSGSWDPDSSDVDRVRQLAASLTRPVAS